jgi:hypothetical protein
MSDLSFRKLKSWAIVPALGLPEQKRREKTSLDFPV